MLERGRALILIQPPASAIIDILACRLGASSIPLSNREIIAVNYSMLVGSMRWLWW